MKRWLSLAVGTLALVLAAGPVHAAGERSVTLDAATLKSGLVRTTTLGLRTENPGRAAYGMVIDPAAVIALRSRIVAARAAVTLADATLTRARHLYRAAGNISEASLQQAQAQAATVRARLAGLRATANAKFGMALGTAIDNGGAPLDAIEAGGSLVSVVHDGAPLAAAPTDARARTQDGSRAVLRSIGLAGRMPRGLLGQAFLYTGPPLAIGTSLAVTLDRRTRIAGYDMPVTALVWHDDAARAFVRAGTHRFTTFLVPTSRPLWHGGRIVGYFVPEAALPDRPAVVTSGAGLLNSALAGSAHAATDDD